MTAIILGGIVHFITMGFGLKISKKILVKKITSLLMFYVVVIFFKKSWILLDLKMI